MTRTVSVENVNNREITINMPISLVTRFFSLNHSSNKTHRTIMNIHTSDENNFWHKKDNSIDHVHVLIHPLTGGGMPIILSTLRLVGRKARINLLILFRFHALVPSIQSKRESENLQYTSRT